MTNLRCVISHKTDDHICTAAVTYKVSDQHKTCRAITVQDSVQSDTMTVKATDHVTKYVKIEAAGVLRGFGAFVCFCHSTKHF